MTDILARIRALHDDMENTRLRSDDLWAQRIRRRFPEAFEDQGYAIRVDVSAVFRSESSSAKILETGSPEQVALKCLAKHECLEAWELHHMVRMANALPHGYSQERLVRQLRIRGLAVWKAKRWRITDAGRAEDARHEVKP